MCVCVWVCGCAGVVVVTVVIVVAAAADVERWGGKNKNTRGIIHALRLYYMLLLLCTYTTPGQGPGLEGGKGSIAAAAHNACTAEG